MGSIVIGRERAAMLVELAAYYSDLYCPGDQSIDPVAIAKGLNLPFNSGNYGGYFEGLIEYTNGGFHVFLHFNEGDNLYVPRVRFSFAHEIGHYVIDEHRQALMRPGVQAHGSQGIFASDLITEYEADFFAACLLMPEHRIRRDIFKRKFNANLVDELRRKYNVSFTAAMLRFIALGNHPIMVVCSRGGKYKWLRYSDDFPFKRLNLGAGKELPENTAAMEFFEDGRMYRREEKVFAEDWFVLWNSYDRRRPFKEYCIYYPALDQVISLLWEG
jgi:hypothetical protein